MLSGGGRFHLKNGSFSKRPNLGEPETAANKVGNKSLMLEKAYGDGGGGMGGNIPDGTVARSYAKPTNVGLNIGLIPSDPHSVIMLAREIYNNDAIAGAVVETMSKIPFGAFSLSGLPDKETAKPYEVSLDRIRSKSLMPMLTSSYMVDGAFLGGGIFDEHSKVWSAIIPWDILHSTITPAPMFGATPIVDINIDQEMVRSMRSGDERMDRYRKHLPKEYLQGGVIKLPLENTFYVPRGTLSHVSLGESLYRNIMVIYLLEKALARGTIEMAYRRQAPLLHITTGDENWEASIQEMQFISDLFMQSSLDPIGAVVVTRPGVTPNEVGGIQDIYKWTDVADVLGGMKLKGLGMPDGLLGGDMALDSVSATLTIFIQLVRQLRETITRLFFYEKFFPYIAITNNHRKNNFPEYKSFGANYALANDTEVDLEDYFTPSISWHGSMRPEGDREYMELLETMRQGGVPIPIRVMAAAGGLDINDILNSAPDDLAIREKVAKINEQIASMEQSGQGGDDQGQDGGDQQQQYASEEMYRDLAPFKRKGIMERDYDFDRYSPRNKINGHTYVTTPRERRRVEERMNKLTSIAAADIAKKLNKQPAQLIKKRPN